MENKKIIVVESIIVVVMLMFVSSVGATLINQKSGQKTELENNDVEISIIGGSGLYYSVLVTVTVKNDAQSPEQIEVTVTPSKLVNEEEPYIFWINRFDYTYELFILADGYNYYEDGSGPINVRVTTYPYGEKYEVEKNGTISHSIVRFTKEKNQVKSLLRTPNLLNRIAFLKMFFKNFIEYFQMSARLLSL